MSAGNRINDDGHSNTFPLWKREASYHAPSLLREHGFTIIDSWGEDYSGRYPAMKRIQGRSALYITPPQNGRDVVTLKFCDLKTNGNIDRYHLPHYCSLNKDLWDMLKGGKSNTELLNCA